MDERRRGCVQTRLDLCICLSDDLIGLARSCISARSTDSMGGGGACRIHPVRQRGRGGGALHPTNQSELQDHPPLVLQ